MHRDTTPHYEDVLCVCFGLRVVRNLHEYRNCTITHDVSKRSQKHDAL
jgi:hypothetical protein